MSIQVLDTGNVYLGSAEPSSGGGQTINNQDITVTANGVYSAAEGYTGLGDVTVDVQPVIESLNVTPSTSAQTITASGCDGYSPINVSAVTSSIDPNITAGNIKDGVSILGVTGSYSPTLGTKNITTNGTYAASSDNLDGFSEVTVNVSGSSDWYNWKNVTEGGLETSSGTMPSTQNWYILSNENGYVAYVYDSNGSNIFAYSPDGTTWTQGTLPTSGFWGLSASAGGMFFLFPQTESLTTFLYSTDGQNWNTGTLPATLNTSKIQRPIFCGSYFLLITGYYSSDSTPNSVYYSADGINWSFAYNLGDYSTSSTYSIATGNGTTILLGTSYSTTPLNCYLFITTNGQNWTSTAAPELDSHIVSVIFFFKNIFYLSAINSSRLCYSSNGTSWTTMGSVLPSSFNAQYPYVADGIVMLAQYNNKRIAYSTNGTSWTAGTLPTNTTSLAYQMLPYKKYFMCKDGNVVYYTSNGSSWSSINLDSNQTWIWLYNNKMVNGDKVVIPSSSSTAEFIINDDTVTTEVYTDTDSPTISSVVYDAPKVASAMTITSVGTGTITLSDTKVYTRNSSGDTQYPLLGTKTVTSNGTYSAEDDNLDGYTEVTVNVPSTGSTVTASNETGASIQSGDKVWMQRMQGNYSILTTPVISANTFTGIAAENIETGSSGAVSATVTPYVPSTFGLKDYGTLPSTYNNWRVLSNGVKYVAFQGATTQTVNAFAYSDDGKNWTSGTLPGNVNSWTRGRADGGRFIINDYGYYDTSSNTSRVVSSADGVNWTSGTYNGKFYLSNTGNIFENGNWYAIVTRNNQQTPYYLARTTNGTSWNEIYSLYTTVWSLVYGNGTLVVTYGSTSYRAAYSTDGGITWTNIGTGSSGLPTSTYTLYCMFDGTKFIAYPANNSTVTDLFTSTDGITWTKHAGALPFTNVISMTYKNGLYWTYQYQGTLGAYSTDGINWTTVQDPIGSPGSVGIFGNYYVITPTTSTPNEVHFSADGHNWDSLQLDSNVTWAKNVVISTWSDQRADKLLIPSTDSTAVAILGE